MYINLRINTKKLIVRSNFDRIRLIYNFPFSDTNIVLPFLIYSIKVIKIERYLCRQMESILSI